MRTIFTGLVASLALAACDPEVWADLSSVPSPGVEQMTGFSWVSDGFAAMPRPNVDDAAFLTAQNVGYVVSLTEDRPVWLPEHGFAGLHLPIEDFQPPTLEQQVEFVAAVDEQIQAGTVVVVHCTAGLGRSGTLVATWFVAQGMPAQAAIDRIRALRPGSIETAAQEAQVHAYAAVR